MHLCAAKCKPRECRQKGVGNLFHPRQHRTKKIDGKNPFFSTVTKANTQNSRHSLQKNLPARSGREPLLKISTWFEAILSENSQYSFAFRLQVVDFPWQLSQKAKRTADSARDTPFLIAKHKVFAPTCGSQPYFALLTAFRDGQKNLPDAIPRYPASP